MGCCFLEGIINQEEIIPILAECMGVFRYPTKESFGRKIDPKSEDGIDRGSRVMIDQGNSHLLGEKGISWMAKFFERSMDL